MSFLDDFAEPHPGPVLLAWRENSDKTRQEFFSLEHGITRLQTALRSLADPKLDYEGYARHVLRNMEALEQ